ncbi:MAG: polysaccharide biosynthesis protein [Bacteroidales bacterium]|nr:polysaccharide biosynthesis protein [Bacteroidales bacterium]
MQKGIVKRLSSYFSSYLNPKVVLAIDLFFSALSSFFVGLLSHYVSSPGTTYRTRVILIWMAVGLVWSLVFYLLLGTYKKVIRHTSVLDMFSFALASLGKGALTFITILIAGNISGFFDVPRNWVFAIAIDTAVTFGFLACYRIVLTAVFEMYSRKMLDNQSCARVMVYGTLEKSVAVCARLHKSSHYKVVGYISHDPRKDALTINKLPVFYVGDEQALQKLQGDLPFSSILFVREEDITTEKDRLVKFATSLGIRTLLAPSIDEVLNGRVLQARIREVRIEDLLGREEIKISLNEIKDYLKDKVVLVTGAAGSIGSELCRQLAQFGIKQLVLFDNAETPMHNIRLELEDRFKELDFYCVIGDVRSTPRVDYVFRRFKPQVVFHAAAYKHVPMMEDNPCEAVRVNLFGTRNIAEKCLEYDAEKMVMISTDKAVNPTNIMGCSKRLAEIFVQSLGVSIEKGLTKGKTVFVTTRFGNVLGSNGSVIPRFREQIAHGGPLTVTHPDITRFFMTIPEACRLVMEAATRSEGNNIFVFDMGEPVKISDLAKRMIELAGFRPGDDIEIKYTGLRPGEKLYEEVLATAENTSPSFHERIRVAHVREYDFDKVLPVLDELSRLSEEVKIPEMVMLMKKVVPEFKSKNSVFEQYDVKQ